MLCTCKDHLEWKFLCSSFGMQGLYIKFTHHSMIRCVYETSLSFRSFVLTLMTIEQGTENVQCFSLS